MQKRENSFFHHKISHFILNFSCISSKLALGLTYVWKSINVKSSKNFYRVCHLAGNGNNDAFKVLDIFPLLAQREIAENLKIQHYKIPCFFSKYLAQD